MAAKKIRLIIGHIGCLKLSKIKKNSIQESELQKPINKSGVYEIKCLPLDKVYIGCSKSVTARVNKHKRFLKNGIHECREMQSDYQKYGLDSFTFNILPHTRGLPMDKVSEIEINLIESTPREKRYNKLVRQETRYDEYPNPFKGKKHTVETLQAQRNANIGKPSGFSGKKQTEAVKEIVSESNRGKTNIENCKPVFFKGVRYPSISEFRRITKFSRVTIRRRVNDPLITDCYFVNDLNNDLNLQSSELDLKNDKESI